MKVVGIYSQHTFKKVNTVMYALSRDVMVLLDHEEKPVQLELTANLDREEKRVHRVNLDPLDSLDHKDLVENPDHKGNQDLEEKTDNPELQV